MAGDDSRLDAVARCYGYRDLAEGLDRATAEIVRLRAEVERLSRPVCQAADCKCPRCCDCGWTRAEACAEVVRLRADNAHLTAALENVRALAARMQRREVPDAADHLLRFCRDVGIEASILRDRARRGER